MWTSSLLAFLLGPSAISSTRAGAAFQTQQTFLGSSSSTPPVGRHGAPPAQCSPIPRKALRCSLESEGGVSLGHHDALPVRESLVHDRDVRSSRRTFVGKVVAGFGAVAAAAAATAVAPRASSAVGTTSRSAEDVKMAIEADFVGRCSAYTCHFHIYACSFGRFLAAAAVQAMCMVLEEHALSCVSIHTLLLYRYYWYLFEYSQTDTDCCCMILYKKIP